MPGILDDTTVDGTVTADEFIGPLTGTATRATADASGNTITTTYLPVTGTSAKTRGLIYLEPTVTTTGVLWSATSSDITSYYNGLMVVVKCPEATATGLTLKINSLTAPTIVYNATSNISSRYAADSIIILTYKTVNNTAYWSIMDYDANTNTQVRQYQVTNNTNYSILARYGTADKSGTYDNNYARFATSVTLNPSTGQVNATNFNGKHSNLTLTPATTGFTIAGGTTSKTLTVDADATISALAPKASPALSGTPTAPTATAGTNTTQIATTAFVQTAITNNNPFTFTTIQLTEVD